MAGPCETGLCAVGPDDLWLLLLLAALSVAVPAAMGLLALAGQWGRRRPGRHSAAGPRAPATARLVHEIEARIEREVRMRRWREPRGIRVVPRRSPDADTVPLERRDRDGGGDE